MNEWRGCNVAWTETRGRLEAFVATDALFQLDDDQCANAREGKSLGRSYEADVRIVWTKDHERFTRAVL